VDGRYYVVKKVAVIMVLLVGVISAFGGMIAEYECAECGYVAEDLFIGGGKTPGVFYVLAYCPECEEFYAASESEIDEGEAVCPVCGAALEACEGEEWVRFEDDKWVYKCPKCGEFAVDEQRVGLWD
jgi:ssDNA-binding Zn-finger/Zn-ribbon topoisomerase 1